MSLRLENGGQFKLFRQIDRKTTKTPAQAWPASIDSMAGIAVILGTVGSNFGAGMTGGMAFVLDADDHFERRANPESIVWQRVESRHWEGVLKALVEDHAKATGSKWSNEVLADWDRWLGQFWQVCPKEMVGRLSHPLRDEEMAVVAAE